KKLLRDQLHCRILFWRLFAATHNLYQMKVCSTLSAFVTECDMCTTQTMASITPARGPLSPLAASDLVAKKGRRELRCASNGVRLTYQESIWRPLLRQILLRRTERQLPVMPLIRHAGSEGTHDQHGQQRNGNCVDVLRPRHADAERKPDARHVERIEQFAAEQRGCNRDQRD